MTKNAIRKYDHFMVLSGGGGDRLIAVASDGQVTAPRRFTGTLQEVTNAEWVSIQAELQRQDNLDSLGTRSAVEQKSQLERNLEDAQAKASLFEQQQLQAQEDVAAAEAAIAQLKSDQLEQDLANANAKLENANAAVGVVTDSIGELETLLEESKNPPKVVNQDDDSGNDEESNDDSGNESNDDSGSGSDDSGNESNDDSDDESNGDSGSDSDDDIELPKTRKELEDLGIQELRNLAKSQGVQANQKRDTMVDEIATKLEL